MAAAVNVNFDGINIGASEKLLKIVEPADSFFPCARFAEQGTTVFFVHGRVTAEDVVFLLVARLVANSPIRHNEIGKRISRAPRVIALVEHGFIEDQVYHDIGNVADLMHGVALLLWEALHNSPGNE